jgi:23S rRNA (cytidine1920-2'-O)/16S rRNA (cytidine1409-2'-O)-methyltransferase
MRKKRLDDALVEAGLIDNRQEAQIIIASGEVFVNGIKEQRPGLLVDSVSQALEWRGKAKRYVGRGGMKLEKALNEFGLDVGGLVVADIGASTGGFTDCLLQRGAIKVYAVDVGYGQLDLTLRQDDRVVNMERTDIRQVESFPDRIDLAVIDVSFISLRQVLPYVKRWLTPGKPVIVLFKPQFEAGEKDVALSRGVIRDESLRQQLLVEFKLWADTNDFKLEAETESPIKGDKGNVEFLLLFRY